MLDNTELFDESFYLTRNPEVSSAVSQGAFRSGFDHFMQFGRFEGRDPSDLFNTNFYLAQNPDVAAAVFSNQVTAFDHFIQRGQLEKRDPNSLFKTRLYLQQNPDVAAAVEPDELTGVENLGRYANKNLKIPATTQTEQLTAIEHFVLFGRQENRPPAQAFEVLDTVLIANTKANNVVRFDPNSGTFLGAFIPANRGGVFAPDTLIYGPDATGDGIRDLFISSGDKPATSSEAGASAILRYDGVTGEFIDVFIGDNPNTPNLDETGGLYRPYGLTFGTDGNLYVSSFLSDQILRYNGTTGQFIDVFATGNQQAGGLNGPNGLLMAPDGNLYVTTQGSVAKNGEADFSAGLPSQILRFNLQTKQSSVFASPDASPDSLGFVSLLGMAVNPENGDLYVSDFANDIRRYNLQTGALVDVLSTNYTGSSPSNNFIGSLAFSPDGNLFTVGFNRAEETNNIGSILRYDGMTGEPLPGSGNEGSLFVADNTQLVRPIGLTFFVG